jgi:hypothetical protein
MDILMNENVQQALVALLVVLLGAAAKWVQSKISQTALLNENWCYLQPVLETVMNVVSSAAAAGKMDQNALSKIVAQALAGFADNYRKFEGKEPSKAVIAAAAAELTDAVGRAAK